MSLRLRLYGELPSLYAGRFQAQERLGQSSSFDLASSEAEEIARKRNRTADLTFRIDKSDCALPAESLRLLVRELIDNACKFSEPGTPIRLEGSAERGFSKLCVSDCGHGMSEAHIREIGAFKQFWSGAERPGGLGLGLVLVQTIVRLHGGEVQIESEAGGTHVTIMVPTE